MKPASVESVGSPWGVPLRSLADFTGWWRENADEFQRRAEAEAQLARRAVPFVIPGYCAVCSSETEFAVDHNYAHRAPDGTVTPNWRERLECRRCRLNSRLRAVLHFFVDRMHAGPRSRIYMSEQTSPLYGAVRKRFKHVTGSEYFGPDARPGSKRRGLRHEDVTRLSFAAHKFDHILSFDVLEHVPDYGAALREMARCLKPGGSLLLTTPFVLESETNVVRATIENGQIRHLLEPEYHSDPVTGSALCYYHFGWQLIDELRASGFSDVAMRLYWSPELGYIGLDQFLILATR